MISEDKTNNTGKFIRFLKDNNAFYFFIKNIKCNSAWLNHAYKYNCPFIIESAFRWRDTNEGQLFWSKLNFMWYFTWDY